MKSKVLLYYSLTLFNIKQWFCVYSNFKFTTLHSEMKIFSKIVNWKCNMIQEYNKYPEIFTFIRLTFVLI